MEIIDHEQNQENFNAVRAELDRTETNYSVLRTMLYKHYLLGNVHIPPLSIQGFNIVEFEARMIRADWMHRFSDDYYTDVRGAAKLKQLRDDIRLLSIDPDGSRVAFYLCERWIPENTYGFPDSLKKDGNRDVLYDAVQVNNYVDLIETIKYRGLRHEGLNLILEQAERYQKMYFPSLFVNGIDIAELEKGLIEAKHRARVESYIGEYATTVVKFKQLFEDLETIGKEQMGRSLADIYWSTYGRDAYLGNMLEKHDENFSKGKPYSKYLDFNREYLKNKDMNVKEVNVNKEDVHRLGETLKFHGMKEIPTELIVDMLVKNQDKSTVEWNTMDEHANAVKVDLNFKKSKENQYLNSFMVTLSKNGAEFFKRYHRVEFGNTLTLKQIVNMAQGRAVGRSFPQKDDNGKVIDRYHTTVMFNFEEKDKKGNVEIVEFPDYNFKALADKYPFDFTADINSEKYFMENLMRGNLTEGKLFINGTSRTFLVSGDARENELVFRFLDGTIANLSLKGSVVTINNPQDDPQKKKNNEIGVEPDKPSKQVAEKNRQANNLEKGKGEEKGTSVRNSRKRGIHG